MSKTRRMLAGRLRPLLAAIAVVASLAMRAQGAITAGWLDDPIDVDGSTGDWPRLQRVGSGPAVAVRNDADTLLLAIASDDERVREQLATGLVVWIDATGRRRQTFGLRLEGLVPRAPAGAEPTAASTGSPADGVRVTHASFDLLGPARLQRRLIDDPESVGMRLATGVEHGMIAYEIQLPLRQGPGAPHAVGAAPGATIALGLETPEPPTVRERRRLEDPMNTNPWVHDPWGYGNYFRPPPPPGGDDRAPRVEPVKPMKLMWTMVQLASN